MRGIVNLFLEKIMQKRMQIHALGMKNAKQKQRGIVGSGGELINHGDTEITKRGALDRIYRIYKIASSGELKIDCRKAAPRAQHRGRCKSIYRILTDGG